MRILLVNTFYAPEIIGGAEYSVKKLAEGLQEAGHDVAVLCTGAKDEESFVDGIRVTRLRVRNMCRMNEAPEKGMAHKVIRRIQDIWNPLNARKFKKVIADFCPDVIHTNGLYDITPVVWKVARKLNVRTVHTLRDYYLCCPLSTLNCDNGGKCRVPGCYCSFYRKLNRSFGKYVNHVTAPSGITLRNVTKYGILDIHNKSVVPNATEYDAVGTEECFERKKAEWHNGKSEITYVYMGALTEQKGILWLLEAFQQIKNPAVKLLFAGKGKLESVVKEACEKDSRIRYVGFLDEAGVNDMLNKADVLLCPSLWEEPFGRVVLDAYKHAMPVISSDRGALPELVKDGFSGMVVPSGEVMQLVLAMQSYAEDPDRIIEHSKNAIECLEQYSLEKQVKRFEEVYTNC